MLVQSETIFFAFLKDFNKTTCTTSLSCFLLVFQATGMELNLSKNGISCGDPGTIVFGILFNVPIFSFMIRPFQ